MVIAYSPNSHFRVDLDKAKRGEIPWYHVLSEPGFKFGRTNPELDPKGYYMIILAKLSNLYYHDPTIEQKILGDDRNPKQLFPEETLRTTLETGQLDAIAAYKHEAISRGLQYITLPPQINLADPTYSDFYKRGSYTLHTGQTSLWRTGLLCCYNTRNSQKFKWSYSVRKVPAINCRATYSDKAKD